MGLGTSLKVYVFTEEVFQWCRASNVLRGQANH